MYYYIEESQEVFLLLREIDFEFESPLKVMVAIPELTFTVY